MLELNTWAFVFVITIMALLIILAAVVLWDCVSLALTEAEAPDARVVGNLPAVAFDPTSFYLQAAYDEPIFEGPTSVWFKIVAALNRDSARLDRAESKFISYMFNKLTSDPAYVPTVPQVKWILHISAKLGRDLP